MEFLLIILIAVFLFGGKAVSDFAIKAILITVGLIMIPLGLAFLSIVLENPNWYVIIPSLLIILLFFLIIKGRNKPKATANANFELIRDGRLRLVKISQAEKWVVLNPYEVRNLVSDWKTPTQGKPFITVFGTTFKLLSIREALGDEIAKEMQKVGVNFYIELQQYLQHSHQTSHTLRLNPEAIVKLNGWMNEESKKDKVVADLFQEQST